MSGTLFLVPNTLDFGIEGEQVDLQEVLPLGVIRTAARLTCWVAENAKTTRAFLKRVDAVVPLALPLQQLSIEELPRPGKGAAKASTHTAARTADQAAIDRLLAPLRAGRDLGLISEAGMPAVADPGAMLVHAAHAAGLRVVPLTGPSSLLLALAASGLNGQSFAFVGYLPVDAGERAARIRELEAQSRRLQQTQLMIETPYRNEALLHSLIAHASPTSELSVSCGLTLARGWTRTASVTAWRAAPGEMPKNTPAIFALLGH